MVLLSAWSTFLSLMSGPQPCATLEWPFSAGMGELADAADSKSAGT